MLISVSMLVGGLLLLVAGGEVLIRGASTIGLRMGMRPMLVGMTIVGFGTSAPELAAALDAALRGSPDLVLGTIVGSNLANATLILGLSAIAAPLVVDGRFALREAPLLVFSGIALALVAWEGTVPRTEALLLLFTLPLVLKVAGQASGEDEPVTQRPSGSWTRPVLETVGGLAALPLGAHWFVGGAVDLATAAGIEERLIGLTLVAVGTSLPELFSSVAAARRGLGSLVVGNVVGSNIVNVFGILALTGVIRPLSAPTAVHADLIAVLVASLAAAVLLVTGQRLTRLEGALMVVGYALVAIFVLF